VSSVVVKALAAVLLDDRPNLAVDHLPTIQNEVKDEVGRGAAHDERLREVELDL
jgi:hypothetical protein